MNKDCSLRVLQVNLEGGGGAFSLVYSIQKTLCGKAIFDYYSMGKFTCRQYYEEIALMGGLIHEEELRKNRLWGHILLPYRFYSFLMRNHYSIIHIHSDTAWKMLLYAWPAKKARVEKVIAHAHSTKINGDYRFVKSICHYFAKAILPYFVDEYIACSEKAAEWVFPKNVFERVKILLNGIEIKQFEYDENKRNRLRQYLKLNDSSILIGCVGDYSYSKNLDFLFKVIGKMFSCTENYYLMIVGDGENRKNYESIAKEMNIDNKIFFIGKMDDMCAAYSAMDLFVMPSRFEGFPMSAVEAQANGLKCIFSDAITQRVGFNNFVFISVRDEDEWIKEMKKTINHANRDMAARMMRDSEMDVKYTSEALLRVYADGSF